MRCTSKFNFVNFIIIRELLNNCVTLLAGLALFYRVDRVGWPILFKSVSALLLMAVGTFALGDYYENPNPFEAEGEEESADAD